jgi:hypothetical protein
MRYFVLTILFFLTNPAVADQSEDTEILQINWRCHEQPRREALFTTDGQVHYTTHAVTTDQPIQVTATKTTPGQNYQFEPARLESSVSYLNRADVLWTAQESVATHDGSVRIDLNTDEIFITQLNDTGHAQFIHFQCQRLPPPAPQPQH